ncbi:MAG: glycosyl hydrolase [Bacillota bacterium]|nr:glycosyl hydrolase [Bacillota bacterium]
MIKFGRGVCYSGYREGQSPIAHVYPTYAQILEDLTILKPHFDYLRMYDVSEHAKTVLRVIEEEKMPFKVMLGVEPRGEISNPNCPWGGLHSDEEIAVNKIENIRQLDRLAELANRYKDIVLAVAVGNECTSEWHSGLMAAETLASHVRYLRTVTDAQVTFCEGAYAWRVHAGPVAAEVDFISIHSYPLWLRKHLDEALAVNQQDYEENKAAYPDKQIIFTEFGWTTSCNDTMDKNDVGEAQQAEYLAQVEKWSKDNQIPMFVFEAFDEPWKGGRDPIEPEKHWGLYNVDRTPKIYISKKTRRF